MKCRVWAPRAERVELVYSPDGERVTMHESERGHFEIDHTRFVPGARYGFSLDGSPPRPDPRSHFQPEGVHGPSELTALDAFAWTDAGFRQAPLEAAVVYELHVGTFTPEGTFDGAIQKLDYLRELGITHVELMPVAAFPGERGWGYDGVALFAPHAAYGGPDALRRLVDACHARGLGVILDVVYNHLGPSGNYLGLFGPYFTDRYGTPWGEAVNYDGAGSDEVRRFVCDNALYWLRHFHIDGLRLDAVHAIFDQSALHVLEQLSSEVDELSLDLARPLVLIAESHLNDPRFVRLRSEGGLGLSSQWSDDFHHALRTVLTGERDSYYSDFGTIADLAEALRHGFAYRGQYSRHRQHSYGRAPVGLSGRHFHVFCQNHDQVGNRAVGDRLGHQVNPGQQRIAAALTLLSPYVSMLFMGEEWGATAPFLYFTDHSEPELGEAVRQGRRREFAAFGWDPERIPDPQARSSFEASKLAWNEISEPEHQSLLAFYRALIQLRSSEPGLQNDSLELTRVEYDETERWLALVRGDIAVLVNFGSGAYHLAREAVALVNTSLKPLLQSDERMQVMPEEVVLPPHSVTVLAKGR
ncbi:MAG TPA: malto-oligosyltrehalose trehalohydrolase [Polyangiaceae bacterium]|nr:malto-oligosyltrehalose trehalohydrolase [Polyangiaceae bacterium]